jgi:hypothetical protein
MDCRIDNYLLLLNKSIRTHLKNWFVLVFSSIRSLAEALEAVHTGGSTGNSSNEG